VLALCTRLKVTNAAIDAEFDALVIAGLEVQAVKLVRRSPVAAEQCVVVPEEHCSRDQFATLHCELEHELFAEQCRDHAKEIAGEVRLVTVT